MSLAGYLPVTVPRLSFKGTGTISTWLSIWSSLPSQCLAEVVPDVAAAGAEGAVVLVEFVELLVGEAHLAGQPVAALDRAVDQVHGQDHGVLVGLALDGRDLAVGAELVEPREPEGVLAVALDGEELAEEPADVLDEERLAVAGLAHQHVGHLLGRAALGRVLDVGDEAVDLVVQADDVLLAAAEDLEVVGGLAVDHDLLDLVIEDHAADRLEGVLEASVARLHRQHVGLQRAVRAVGHDRPHRQSGPCQLWFSTCTPGRAGSSPQTACRFQK